MNNADINTFSKCNVLFVILLVIFGSFLWFVIIKKVKSGMIVRKEELILKKCSLCRTLSC